MLLQTPEITWFQMWINQFFRNLQDNTLDKCWRCIVLSFSLISGFSSSFFFFASLLEATWRGDSVSFNSSFCLLCLLLPLICAAAKVNQTGLNGTEITTMYSIWVYTDGDGTALIVASDSSTDGFVREVCVFFRKYTLRAETFLRTIKMRESLYKSLGTR